MTEHTTPTPAEVHAILTLSLQNSKALKGTHQHRAGVLMDDLSDAGLCITWKTPPESTDATENTIQTMGTDGDGVTHSISLPCPLGRDQEAREGLERELWVADVDATTEPHRVAIDYTNTSDYTTPNELGWFDVRTMVRQLAEFAPDLVVMRREDLPEVVITEHMTEPTTCTVDIGGVRRFSGADWTHHGVDAMHLRAQLTEARAKLATADSTTRILKKDIADKNRRITELEHACQQKNSDCERYATERRTAIEAQMTAENAAGDLRARWAAYATALARLEDTTKPQVIGKHVVMRHETLTQLETECDQLANSNVTTDQLDQERRDHKETRRELRAMTAHARKWQRFAAVIELMEDAGDAELTIDGVQIRVVKP